jgi:hypothetical protein
MAKVRVFVRVKMDGKYRYYAASVAANGRIEPFVAVVKGRRKRFDSVAYYIRFTGPDGKQKFKGVGNDPALARTKQIEKQFELDGTPARGGPVAILRFQRFSESEARPRGSVARVLSSNQDSRGHWRLRPSPSRRCLPPTVRALPS